MGFFKGIVQSRKVSSNTPSLKAPVPASPMAINNPAHDLRPSSAVDTTATISNKTEALRTSEDIQIEDNVSSDPISSTVIENQKKDKIIANQQADNFSPSDEKISYNEAISHSRPAYDRHSSSHNMDSFKIQSEALPASGDNQHSSLSQDVGHNVEQGLDNSHTAKKIQESIRQPISTTKKNKKRGDPKEIEPSQYDDFDNNKALFSSLVNEKKTNHTSPLLTPDPAEPSSDAALHASSRLSETRNSVQHREQASAEVSALSASTLNDEPAYSRPNSNDMPRPKIEPQKAPQVNIGQVNVVVESIQPASVANAKPQADDLSSRLFLRSL